MEGTRFAGCGRRTGGPGKFRRITASFILIFFIAFMGISLIPVSGSAAPKPKVVMVMLNRVTVDEITGGEYPNIGRLISAGGLGLMTVNTGGELSDINSYVSLGGGDKFVGSPLTGEGYNRDEVLLDGSKAYQVYRRHTGKDPGQAEVLNTSIAATLKANQKRYTTSTPGLLGTVLHKAGLKTAVIGNSDLDPAAPSNRLAVTIAMDDLGRVDQGNVGREMLKKDPLAPFGWKTDYDKLTDELDRVWDKSDFIVVETGDTIRVNENSKQLMKRMVELHRKQALKRADEFIGQLIPKINGETMVILVTPLAHAEAIREGVRLTPVVIAGGQIKPGSVLTSASTRHKGLVANYDITATVVSHLGAQPSEGILGLPVEGLAENEQTGSIMEKYEWLTANSRQRVGILYYFTRYQWIVYAFVLLQIVFRHLWKVKVSRALLIGIMVYPLVLLLVPLTGSQIPWLSISLSLALLALAVFLVNRVRDDLRLFIIIAILNVVPSVVDVVTGGYLMSRAALSYDVVVGGRYYGIGNEYMGVVIGSAILGASALLQMSSRPRQILVGIGMIFVGLIVFFAAPGAGSKAGGALTAMIGFSAAMYKYLGGRVRLRYGILLLGALTLGVAVLAAVNYIFPAGEQSHIGRAFSNLFAGNFSVILQIAIRKFMANMYLLQHSPFTTILVLHILTWAGLAYRYWGTLRSLAQDRPYLKAGMVGMLFGALAAIGLNDSGVIGAPLLLNYLTGPLAVLVLEKAFVMPNGYKQEHQINTGGVK